MDKFLETSAQPKLIQEETNSLNRHNKEILKIMKGFLTSPKKKAKPRWSHSKICPDFQRKTTSSASQVIQKKKKKRNGRSNSKLSWNQYNSDSKIRERQSQQKRAKGHCPCGPQIQNLSAKNLQTEFRHIPRYHSTITNWPYPRDTGMVNHT